jgi:hypothetical protein
MTQPNRREMLGAIGTLATAGGWIGLTASRKPRCRKAVQPAR